MAILLPAVGDPRRLDPANGRAFTVEELQTAVGGYIETVETAYLEESTGRPLYLVCNEDGIREGVAVNAFASAIARVAGLGPLVGDVVFCTYEELGERDEDEALERELADLTDAEVDDFLANAPPSTVERIARIRRAFNKRRDP